MAFGSAVNSGHYDANQNPSLIGVIGTLGTADTSGTALTLPIGVQKDTGAMYVWIAGTDVNTGGGAGGGSMVNVVTGTQQTLGTVGTILGIGGTVQVSGASAGTNVNIVTGTQQTLGTVGVLNTGTINALASGTITGGTLQNLVSGTINAIAAGTITTGTVVNNGGSVSIQGLQANAAAAVGNPFPVGGTDSGGTVRSILVDSTGVQRSTGSAVMTVGTLTTGTLQNLATGTINALAAGTITGGTLQNVVSGTINALAAGTITTGTVSVTTGTIVGNIANAVAASGNPVTIAGVDATSSGTVRYIAVDTTGQQKLASSGTLLNLATGTLAAVTTVTTVSNLKNGSVVMTVGTLTTGTLQNLVSGTINALAAGTITGGTLGNLNYGTVATDTKPVQTGTYSVTVGTTGAAVWGTLISSVGAGNRIYLAGLDISVVSGTVEVAVTNNVAGSTGTGVFTRGNFPAGGGISKPFIPALFTGTGGTLAYWLGGAGTVDFSYQYWVGA